MQVADYVVDELIKYGVTDAFGIPGGVILKLLYAMKQRESELSPHLNYHEQMAGFAACGFAQASGKLCVAYATRGPGIANMLTCILEAFQESLPVLFITAHSSLQQIDMRFENDQEFDVVQCVSKFTKYAASIDSTNELYHALHEACEVAINGRKGPVLLDFSSLLWDQEIESIRFDGDHKYTEDEELSDLALKVITDEITISRRPIILIGDGIRHALETGHLYHLAEKLKVPILSSRGAQDLLSGSPYYFGYIGSHGIRYSNFILSKADLIISIGNRLAFPVSSASFSPIVTSAKVIRLDIDKKEFNRKIPDVKSYKVDAHILLNKLLKINYCIKDLGDWVKICNQLKIELTSEDCTKPVQILESFIKKQEPSSIYVCDIGNNEFWFARAFEKVGKSGMVLYSKTFGTLGAGLGRAIGAYYASGKDIVCIIGDQGFQYNVQELQYISKWKIPIKIIILNNCISGMISDHEKRMFGNKLFHVNSENGYYVSNFEKIAKAYEIDYTTDESVAIKKINKQLIYEIRLNIDEVLTPSLSKGMPCQDMEPLIPREKFNYLNKL